MAFFNLAEGEKIVWESKPLPGLMWFLFATHILGWIFLFLFFGVYLLIPLLAMGIGAVASGFFSILVGLLLVSYITASLQYGKEYYWITNQRAVHKHGFIGYTINSIPLERISDVIISRSFVESIFSIASIHIQSLAGQASYGRFGAEGKYRAVPNPEELQQVLFKLIKENRQTEHLGI